MPRRPILSRRKDEGENDDLLGDLADDDDDEEEDDDDGDVGFAAKHSTLASLHTMLMVRHRHATVR